MAEFNNFKEVPIIFVDHVMLELSAQVIGEPTLGVWCSTCNLPSAEVRDLAILLKRFGEESYECDPVINLVTLWGCHDCGNIFQLPDSPSLKDNRDS